MSTPPRCPMHESSQSCPESRRFIQESGRSSSKNAELSHHFQLMLGGESSRNRQCSRHIMHISAGI